MAIEIRSSTPGKVGNNDTVSRGEREWCALMVMVIQVQSAT